MKSFDEYTRLLMEAEVDQDYRDQSILNYFTDLYQRNPALLARSSELAHALSRFWRDENAPKDGINSNNNDDIATVRDIATWAKQSALDNWNSGFIDDDSSNTYPLAGDRTASQEPPVADPIPFQRAEQPVEVESEPETETPEEEDRYQAGLLGVGLNQKQINRIKRLNKSGWSDERIGARLGIPAEDVGGVLSRGKYASTRITKAQKAEITNLAKQGMRPSDIGFHVDVPVWLIKQTIDKLPAPPEGERMAHPQDWEQFHTQQDLDTARQNRETGRLTHPQDKPFLGRTRREKADEREVDRLVNLDKINQRQAQLNAQGWGKSAIGMHGKQIAPTSLSPNTPDYPGYRPDVDPLKPYLNASYGSKNFAPSPEQTKQIIQMHRSGKSSPRGIALELGIPFRHVKSVIGDDRVGDDTETTRMATPEERRSLRR